MTIGSILRQIQQMAGDSDKTRASMEHMLSTFSDESRFCMVMFPQQVVIASLAMTGNSPTSVDSLKYMTPKYVWIGESQCQKIFATDMAVIINQATGASSGYYWSMIQNVLNVTPANSAVRVIGDLYLHSDYSTADLEYVPTVSASRNSVVKTIPGLSGGPLQVARYRTAQRLSESLGDFQRAQYFLQMSTRLEADVRSTNYESSSTSLGFVHGSDF